MGQQVSRRDSYETAGKSPYFIRVKSGFAGVKLEYSQCVAVVFFMGMPLGATHQTSSSFFVFFGPDGFHGLKDLTVEVLEPLLEFLRRTEHNFHEEAFEQASGDVSIGLVIMLALFVYFFDFGCFCSKKNGLEVIVDKVRINILPAVIDGISGKIGKFQERFDDEKAGFDAPTLAVYFSKISVFETFGISQGGEQHFDFAGGQYHPNEAVGDGGLNIDGDAQFIEHHTGLVREFFRDDLLFFLAGNEGFYGVAEANRHSDDAMGAVVLMQIWDGVGSMAPVINDTNILRDLGDGALGYHCFGHMAGVELHGGHYLVENIVVGQQTGGRHPVVLVAVPTELFAKPFLIGQPETGAVGGPQAHAFPAFGFETLVKQRNAEHEHVLEEFGHQFLAGLHEGAFGRGKFPSIKPVEEAVEFDTKRTF